MLEPFSDSNKSTQNKNMTFNTPPRFIERVTQIIEDNIYDESFGTNELSDALSLSTSQVYRKIKRATNLSTSLFIRKVRLEKAHELLEFSDLLVSDIAFRTGFTSLAYFSRSFTKAYGYTPSDVRKK